MTLNDIAERDVMVRLVSMSRQCRRAEHHGGVYTGGMSFKAWSSSGGESLFLSLEFINQL